MDLFKYIIDKLLEEFPGGVEGLISVAVVISLSLLALFFNSHYIAFEGMVSELGVGQGGIFFNIGLILSGIIAIPFFISLGRTLNCEDISEKLRKRATNFSIIACISMSLIGCFPAVQENGIMLYIHGICTSICWFSGFIFIILFGILFLQTSKFSKIHAYLSFIVAGVFALVLLTWWVIFEYMVIIAISIWVAVISLHTLYNDN
jgi:hypothetical protein